VLCCITTAAAAAAAVAATVVCNEWKPECRETVTESQLLDPSALGASKDAFALTATAACKLMGYTSFGTGTTRVTGEQGLGFEPRVQGPGFRFWDSAVGSPKALIVCVLRVVRDVRAAGGVAEAGKWWGAPRLLAGTQKAGYVGRHNDISSRAPESCPT
jgi:hypothetical protein